MYTVTTRINSPSIKPFPRIESPFLLIKKFEILAFLTPRGGCAHKASQPNLRNHNSDQAEIFGAVQNPQNKLAFKILGQSDIFWRFCGIFVCYCYRRKSTKPLSPKYICWKYPKESSLNILD